MAKLIIIWALAALFTINTLLVTWSVNFNAGIIAMWVISLALIGYGIFHKPIDAFLAVGFGRVVKYVVAAGLVVFVGLFAFVALSGYTDNAQGNERAIIVLGAGLKGEQVGDMLRRRLEAGLDAWQDNQDAYLVVTGGQGPGEDIPEALAMQRWLLARGVPPDKIILEDKSTSTEENLAFAKELLAAKGVNGDAPVAVVSNAFHCYRGRQYAKKVGFTTVHSVPASMNLSTLLPSYIREMMAIVYYWVFRR